MIYSDPIVITVSQLNRYVKAKLDEDSNLCNVFVTGEISNFTKHFKTGHLYFTVKDSSAAIKAVMFSSNASKLKFLPQDGLHVLIRGRVSLYEATGQYQLYVDDMQPEGQGALNLAFEQTKEKLQKEGLFDIDHKKKLPPYPQRVGVITSSVGAALQDILNILSRRFPLVEVILAPARVQGDGAHIELIQAIQALNQLQMVDVIILGRGGGSIEDLWEFNNEELARAIYQSAIPIVSAVGHETDFTIADFVADLRAPTPSAAAELIVPDKIEQKMFCSQLFNRLQKQALSKFEREKLRISAFKNSSALKSSSFLLDSKKMQLSELSNQITKKEEDCFQKNRMYLSSLASKLDALSPLSVLDRGYAIAKLSNETVLHSVKQADAGERFTLQVTDGTIDCIIEEIHNHEKRNDI